MNVGANGTISDVTSATVEKLKATPLSVVDFWASWCVPCKKLAPLYEAASVEITAKRPGQVGFFKIDVEKEPALADTYGVMSIPTVLAFSGGKPVDRFSGRTKEDLVRWIEKLAGSSQG